MDSIIAIPIPLPHIGSVNAWLLQGDPLTLVDTGPCSDAALGALEAGLARHGVRLEDLELVIGTHHHHDHIGLAATIKRRAGARIALLAAAADYAARYAEHVEADRAFSHALMREHGVPPGARVHGEAMWDYIAGTSESVDADVRLHDGDAITAGGRRLRVVARPGHSRTDTLFIDAASGTAFVGDHLLAEITANTEISATPGTSRGRPRVTHLAGLRRTAELPLRRLLTGHGPEITDHRALIARQLAGDRRRGARVLELLTRAPASAFALAEQLWDAETARAQPLLVIWEALGVLDLLLAHGLVAECPDDRGHVSYALAQDTTGGHRLARAS